MSVILLSPMGSRIARIGTFVGIAALLASCSNNTDLEEANKRLETANARIAALEAKLAVASPPAPAAHAVPVAPSSSAAVTSQPTGADEAAGKQWHYDADEDAMTGKKRFTAVVESSNTVALGFPYNGEQRGRLTLRTHPQYGKDVIFQIEKGQILCPSYEGCQVQVRFDDGKPVRFEATGAADHSTELVFIDDYSGFVSKMKKAKRVRLAVKIYQNGAPPFEFDVSGFDAGKYQPKA